MKVMMFAKASKQSEAGAPPTAEAILAMHKFNEELEQAGVLVTLGGLTPSIHGVRVKYRGGRRTVVDGPFSETKELIAGFAILEVKDMAEAIEWVKRAPFDVGLDDDDAPEVEIRPLFDPSNFDPQP